MTFGGYDAFDDPYTYKGTSALRNRLGIRDPAILEAFEVEMSTLRADEPLPNGKLGAAHYRGVHRHLFQDAYVWAGRYRTVRTAKGGSVFCYPENIRSEMDRLFTSLKRRAYLRTDGFAEFVAGAAEFLSELNAIHPFREGNGRAQLAFLHVLAEKAGHPLAFEHVRQTTFMPAMATSFGGELGPLIRELTALRVP